MFADVAVARGVPEPLTYAVPDELETLVAPGVRVRVPLRGRPTTGLVVAVATGTDLDARAIRPISEVLDPAPLLPAHLLDVARFISRHYRCPLGTTLTTMLPASLLRSDAEEVALTRRGAAADAAVLTPGQGAVLEALQARHRMRVATLIASAGLASRAPVDAVVAAGLARIRRRRRDRPPQIEVAAVALPHGADVDELVARASRARAQQRIIRWLAQRGGPALLAEVCAAVECSPATVRAAVRRGLLDQFTQMPSRPRRWTLHSSPGKIRLTDEQQDAVATVVAAVGAGSFAPVVLEGITGSGKTEVYLRCLQATLDRGLSGIVLVPEIGLTPATSGAVERCFGDRVAVLHSAQSDGERWHEWQRVRDRRARIVVGPRSALFAPLSDLGLIVVDEEHDAAYKQQEAPRYHARDVALVLGKETGVPVVLCSATPSVESHALVQQQRARLLRLTRRVGGGALPEVELVDLRAEPPDPGEQGRTLFSRRLREAMTSSLDGGGQVILLMQRRGWAPLLMCRDCGHRVECPACSVSLVVHRRSRDLRCHYCGHRQGLPRSCPSCGGDLLDPMGAGTEKVAHHLERLFPGVPAAILDRDTVRRRDGLETTLGAFAAGRARILVGTQMVAKGHHFPNVTLTGVISADSLLSLPDYRASERTFQLLTQVAGRAGRGQRPGHVVVQTYHPDHPAVQHASRHDVASFLADELVYRRTFSYPPMARMAVLRFEASSATAASTAAEDAARRLEPPVDGVRLRGPAPCPIERIRGRWRHQILVSARSREQLRALLDAAESAPVPGSVRRVVDVDPISAL